MSPFQPRKTKYFNCYQLCCSADHPNSSSNFSGYSWLCLGRQLWLVSLFSLRSVLWCVASYLSFILLRASFFSTTEVWVTANLIKSPGIFSVFHLIVIVSRKDSGLYKYYLSAWQNFNRLHNYYWITFPTLSCIPLYSFCISLLHSHSMWSTFSSLSLHKLRLQFYCLLSIFAFI